MDDYEVVVSYRKCIAHDCPPRSCDFCESSIQTVLKYFSISTLYGFKELVFFDDGSITGHGNYFNTFVEQKHHHFVYPVNYIGIRLKESVREAQIKAVIANVVLTNKIEEYKVDGDKYMTAKANLHDMIEGDQI